MEAEKPAAGILRTHDFGNSKWYKIVCGCGQPDHEVDVEVEADETGVHVNTYVTVKTDYWSEKLKHRYFQNSVLDELDWYFKNLVNGLARRLKFTWDIWTKGYIKAQTTIQMNEQQAINYAETLRSAVKDCRELCTNAKDANR